MAQRDVEVESAEGQDGFCALQARKAGPQSELNSIRNVCHIWK